MKQYEAVIKAMEQNGGYATLGLLYQKALKVKGVEWKTKTPFASIRRIVQDPRFFFKIKPGLWALKGWEKRLPAEMKPAKKPRPSELQFDHTYYQGLVVQIGNLKRFETFVPAQDKNRRFLAKETLGSLASLTALYPFSYPNIIRRANTIDVIWFNTRRMPSSIFEIEHSTNIKDSLIKFVELQDFRIEMFIIAPPTRKRQFQDTITLSAFEPIKNFVRFLSYPQLSQLHSRVFKLKALEDKIYKA